MHRADVASMAWISAQLLTRGGGALGDPAKFAAMVEGHKSALCGNQPVRHAIEQTSRRWREGAVKF